MKRAFTRFFFINILSVCLATIAFGQGTSAIPVDPNVRIGKLKNGLTYYIRHNTRPENQADFYIAQKVGSILEEDNQRGLAHFLEHMCFNGTTHFPGNTLREYLESVGVKFGANLNAYTSIDETVYNISNVPVTREGIIDSCLLILHDWANDLTLDPKEIDKERGVIHEEWRTSMGAMMRMYETTFPKIFAGSKYAYRLPIGIMEVVDNFPYQELRDYYEKWYRPDLQGIIVVGDIDVEQIEAKIKTLFSSIPEQEKPAERKYFPVPDNKEPIITIAKDKEQEITQIYIFHKHDPVPAEQKHNIDYLIHCSLVNMAENMLNARLNELTQIANPPFIGAGVGDIDFILSKTKQAFTGIAACKEDGIGTALSALMRELERARRFGFTKSEYERAKIDFLRWLETAYNERNKTQNNDYVQEYISHFIDNEPIPGIENEYKILSSVIPQITVDAVNHAFKQLISDENLVTCLYCPDKAGMKYPTEKEIIDLINAVKSEDIKPYVDKVTNEPLLKETPHAGKVVHQTAGQFGSTVLTLSNGVRVILKPTDFKADEIKMKAFSRGGTSLFDDKDVIQFSLINDVVPLGGIGDFSAIELNKMLAGKLASASTSVSSLSENANGSCTPQDLETMLQLTYLSFTAPRMDNDAFESFKSRMKAQLSNIEANPDLAMSDTLRKEAYGNNPRILRLKAEMIDLLDYQKIIELYNDRFKDASDFTFIFVGNIEQKTAIPLIETYIGGLPSINRQENFRDRHTDILKGKRRNVFHKELETPKASIVILKSGEIPYNLKNCLMAEILSQLLTMEYTEAIREQEGGSYSVYAGTVFEKFPKEHATLQIAFDTAPSKRSQMTNLVKEKLNKFAEDGLNVENLKKVKEYLTKRYNAGQKENAYWMSALYTYYWENVNFVDNYIETLNSITQTDLQRFMKNFLSQGNEIEVSMTSGDTN